MAMFSHAVGSLAKSPVPRDQTKTLASSLWEDWYGCSVWSLAQPLIWKCMRNRADRQKTRQNSIMGTGDKTPPAFEDPSCLGIDFFFFFLARMYLCFRKYCGLFSFTKVDFEDRKRPWIKMQMILPPLQLGQFKFAQHHSQCQSSN